MSRIKTFVDFKNKQADDVVEILDQVGITVSQYRQPSQDGSTGFDSEVSGHTFLRNILMYLQPDKSGVREVSSEASRGTELRYVGITMETDVHPRDIFKHKGNEYHVISVDDTSVAKTEIKLVRRI